MWSVHVDEDVHTTTTKVEPEVTKYVIEATMSPTLTLTLFMLLQSLLTMSITMMLLTQKLPCSPWPRSLYDTKLPQEVRANQSHALPPI